MALNIFGDAPQSLTGLLGEQATEDLRKKALTTGLINAAIGYIAQPKTMGYGSALPYIGRALMAGQQGAQGVYEGAITDWERQQKIAEMKRQQQQREAFDTASQNLYTTTPAQFETVSTPGGYAPQQTGIMSDQVSPNYGMTRLPDVTTQRQIAPARQELNQEALMKLALSGDPRAKTYVDTLVAMKDLNPAAKPTGRLLTTEQAELEGLPTDAGQRWQQKPDRTYELVSGTGPSKELGLTEEPNRVAIAKFNKPFNKLNQKEAQEVNSYIESRQVNVARASVPSQQPGFKDAGELRKEYNALPQVKAFSEVQNAFDQIKTGISATSAAGDLTAATKFMKLLDPGSVVRESELGMAMAATGVLDRALAYKDFIAKGTKLSVAQRADFLNVAQQLYNAAAARKREIDTQYADIANVGGLDPNLVIGSPATQGAVRNKIMQELQRRQGQK